MSVPPGGPVTVPAVRLPEQLWAQAVGALRSAGQVALACHVTPDGDALGSMLALALALHRLGQPVTCSYSGYAGVLPANYRFLPGQQLLAAPSAFPPAPEVLVTLDTSSVDRLAELAAPARAAGTVLVVDHHARGDGYGTIRLVDPHAAATAVVVDELVRRLAVPLDRDIATCVYAGVSTDTGSFRFAATSPAVHQLAARLLATGIAHDEIARAIWDTNRFGYLRLLAAALDRSLLEPAAVRGQGLVWTHTTREDLAAHRVDLQELEGVIDVLRTAAEADVAVVCKQDPDGSWKVSTRSKGAVDVGAVCAGFGGGGHRFAAGYTSAEDLPTTMASLRAALDRA